ncbi:MAG: hypothetical protein SFV32_00335 [Opitutaceae bacterium]|nr:hypothetical protein [Opitutaceae bacterium]
MIYRLTAPSARSFLHKGVAAWLLVAVAWVTWLAASPSAHHHVHTDASETHHSCAVTLFAQEATPVQADDLLVQGVCLREVGRTGVSGAEAPATNPSALWPWAMGPPVA